jgi:hypothetical protein
MTNKSKCSILGAGQGFVNCLLMFQLLLIPLNLYAQSETDWNLFLKKEKIDTKVFDSKIDKKSLDEPIATWQILQVVDYKPAGNDKHGLIVAFTARSDEGAPILGGVAFFIKDKKSWLLEQFETVNEYMVSIDLSNLIGNENKDLIVNSESGNHGRTMDVYKYEDGEFKPVFHLDGYNAGPQVTEENGKEEIIDFRNSFIDACEGCQACYEIVYKWDGKTFTPSKSSFDECIVEYYKNYEDEKHRDEHIKKAFKLFNEYLKNNPNSFAAAYNCYGISRDLGLKDEEKKYKEISLKIGLQNPEGPHWDRPDMSWQKQNQLRLIQELSEE